MARSRYSGGYNAYPPYVPVSQKLARNRKAVAKLRKGNGDIRPVVVEGNAIAKNWWGKSWNANLERYADYSNRIGRGRSYVRHGAVLDLHVDAGTVTAQVQGSRSKPYDVAITIAELPASVWDELRDVAIAQLDSLADLLAGKFPQSLKDAFFAQGRGLFPNPKQISFNCSCPDWASMCKHVAAALYGIGNRLDAAPELLFTLRQVSVDDLIARTVDATTEGLISKAEQAEGEDVLIDTNLSSMFGIELDDGSGAPIDLPAPAVKASGGGGGGENRCAKKATGSSASGKPAGPTPKRPASKRRRSRTKEEKPERGRMLEQFVAMLGRSRATFTTADMIVKLPAWTRTQVTNTLQRAVNEGMVKRVERGIYRRV